MDISVFWNWFINELSKLVSFCFSLLDNIKFNGISLLTYFIMLTILGVLVPLLINLVTADVRSGGREARKKGGIPDDPLNPLSK